MTNSEIFKLAHKKARSVVKVVGDYMIAFKLSLIEVYKMLKNSINSIVCVAADHSYDESMGAFTTFTLFDTVNNSLSTKGGMYSDLSFDAYTVDATDSQIKQATKIYMESAKELSFEINYIDCIVTLKRSRKAPNKKPLKVIGYAESYYNGTFYTNETINLEDTVTGETFFNVSTSCIKDIVKGVKKAPYWAKL
jgi:hypothetical protein